MNIYVFIHGQSVVIFWVLKFSVGGWLSEFKTNQPFIYYFTMLKFLSVSFRHFNSSAYKKKDILIEVFI